MGEIRQSLLGINLLLFFPFLGITSTDPYLTDNNFDGKVCTELKYLN